jgi:hypothetical protein
MPEDAKVESEGNAQYHFQRFKRPEPSARNSDRCTRPKAPHQRRMRGAAGHRAAPGRLRHPPRPHAFWHTYGYKHADLWCKQNRTVVQKVHYNTEPSQKRNNHKKKALTAQRPDQAFSHAFSPAEAQKCRSPAAPGPPLPR